MKPLPLVQRILGCLTVKWMEGLTFHLYLMPFCPETRSCRWATWYVYRSIWGKAFLRAAEQRVSPQLSWEDPETRRQEVSLAQIKLLHVVFLPPWKGTSDEDKNNIWEEHWDHLFCPECQSLFMCGWSWGFLFMHPQTWSLWSLYYNKWHKIRDIFMGGRNILKYNIFKYEFKEKRKALFCSIKKSCVMATDRQYPC